MQKSKNVSIVVPVYNEKKLLEKSIRNLVLSLRRIELKYELILVENGSNDSSPRTADLLQKRYKEIKVFHLSYPNYGKALTYGYSHANGEILANFSVDWIDVAFLKKALSLIDTYDLIIASKNIADSRDERPLLRHLGSNFYHWLVKLLFFIQISDTHGIKVFRRNKLVNILRKCQHKSETYETEIVIRSYKKGIKIKELPVYVKEKRPTRVKILPRGIKGLFGLFKLRISLFLEGIY